MKKIGLCILGLLLLTACARDPASETQLNKPERASTEELQLTINGSAVDVAWEENASVEALRDLCREAPLTIETHQYDDFEQVGSLGTTLPAENVEITTEPGDIVLYNEDQLVLFYGSNTWSYTKLGKILKTPEELTALLDVENVVVEISLN